jgi:hypothetical protein
MHVRKELCQCVGRLGRIPCYSSACFRKLTEVAYAILGAGGWHPHRQLSNEMIDFAIFLSASFFLNFF